MDVHKSSRCVRIPIRQTIRLYMMSMKNNSTSHIPEFLHRNRNIQGIKTRRSSLFTFVQNKSGKRFILCTIWEDTGNTSHQVGCIKCFSINVSLLWYLLPKWLVSCCKWCLINNDLLVWLICYFCWNICNYKFCRPKSN